jgi:23S rRNA (uracil-5-)-methyltransferase RumA
MEVELDLQEWGPRGYSTALLNGRKIVVDRGIPGERVLTSVYRGRKPPRAMVERVIVPSPARGEPRCVHYAEGCGGCQLQHVNFAQQLSIKLKLVNQQLMAAGVQRHVDRFWTMDDPWRYRHTAAIALGWEAGFRPRGKRGIIAVHDCLIAHPLIGRLCHRLNELLRAGALPNYHARAWVDCTVVVHDSAPALQLVIQAITGLTPETNPELPEVAATLAEVESVVSVAYRHRCGEVRTLVGAPASTTEVAGRPMLLPAGSFSQTNPSMLIALLRRMRSILVDAEVVSAADVYGGAGTLGLSLADLTEIMTIIELDENAIDAARKTAGEWGLQNVGFLVAHAERSLPLISRFDLIILDPPRSGLGDAVIGALSAHPAPLVLYVSCAPPSQARDLAALERAGYRVDGIELFDFYPQTYHVESLAVLRR